MSPQFKNVQGGLLNAFSGGPIAGLVTWDCLQRVPKVQKLFKHLSRKKDAITKRKALEAILEENFLDFLEDYEVVSMLKDWTLTLKKIVVNRDRSVRYNGFRVHGLIVKKCGKELLPYLREMMGWWYLGMNDFDDLVRQSATSSFQSCFPKKKRKEVLKYCQDSILERIIFNLNQTVTSLSNSKETTKVEAEEKYNLIVGSSMMGLKLLVESLPDIENDKLDELCGSKHFWKYLTIRHFSLIRAAAFQFTAAVCNFKSDLLKPHLRIISPLVLGCFSEKDPRVHEFTVEALVSFLTKFPDSWQYVDLWKSVFPHLWTFLQNPSISSPSKTFSTLMPFLSLLKPSVIGPDNVKTFFAKFFESLWIGFKLDSTSKFDKPYIFQAYIECLMYSFIQTKKFISEGDDVNDFRILFYQHIKEAFQCYLETQDELENSYCDSLAMIFTKLLSKKDLNIVLQKFWMESFQYLLTQDHKDSDVVFGRYFMLLGTINEHFKLENDPMFVSEFALNFWEKISHQAIEDLSLVGLKYLCKLLEIAELSHLFSQKDSTEEFENKLIPRAKEVILSNDDIAIKKQWIELLSFYFVEYYDEKLRLYEDFIEFLRQDYVLLYHHIHSTISHFDSIENQEFIQNFALGLCKQWKLNIKENKPIIGIHHQRQIIQFLISSQFMDKNSIGYIENLIIDVLTRFSESELSIRRNYYVPISELIDFLGSSFILNDLSTRPSEFGTMIFNLRLIEESDNSKFYISESFLDDSEAIGYSLNLLSLKKDDHLQNVISKVWSRIKDKVILKKKEFAENAIAYCKKTFTETGTQINSKNLLTQVLNVVEWAELDENWKGSFIYDRDLWRSVREKFTKSVLVLRADGENSLMMNVDNPGQENLGNILNYAKFVDFIHSLIDKQDMSEIFFAKDRSIQHIWLLQELIYAKIMNQLFSRPLQRKLENLVFKIIPLFWKTSDVIILGDSENYTDWQKNMMTMISHFIKDSNTGNSYSEFQDFMNATINHLSKESNTSQLIQLFQICWQNYLFSSDYLETVSSDFSTNVIDAIVECFFNPYRDKNTQEFVVNCLQNIFSDDRYYQDLTEWIGKSVSSLLSVREAVKENFCAEVLSQLRRILNLQKSLTVLTFFLNPTSEDEVKIDMDTLVKSVTDFLSTEVMDSEHVNNLLPVVEPPVSGMLFTLHKNDELDVLNSQSHFDFIVEFFEQHVVMTLGALESQQPSEVAVLMQKLQTFIYMEEMLETFLLTKIKQARNQGTQLYSRLIEALISFYEFDKVKKNTFLFRNIMEKMLYKIAFTVLNIPMGIYRDLDSDFRISKQMIEILQEGFHPGLLISAAKLLKCHKDSSFFLSKVEILDEDERKYLGSSELTLSKEFLEIIEIVPIDTKLKLSVDFVKQFATGELYVDDKSAMLIYLLGWDVFIELYSRSKTEQKQALVNYLKRTSSASYFLQILFSFVLHTTEVDSQQLQRMQVPKDITKADVKVPISLRHKDFGIFASCLLFKMIRHFPSIFRKFFKGIESQVVRQHIESFICDVLTPPIIVEEFEQVLYNTPDLDPSFNIKFNIDDRLIKCVYHHEDVNLEMTLEIPSMYPLKPIMVTSADKIGVNEEKRKTWIMKMTAMVFKQKTIWDSINLWIKNISSLYQNIEPCPICYSTIHADNFQPPQMHCKTCKNKFHGACLFKWFRTSSNNSCPMCRSVNSFVRH